MLMNNIKSIMLQIVSITNHFRMSLRRSLLLKALFPKNFTQTRNINRFWWTIWKHDASTRMNFESFSKMMSPIWFNLLQSLTKHGLLKTSAEREMQVDFGKQEWKYNFSIWVDFESLSNVIVSTIVFGKHDSPRTSTERGMQIDVKKQEWKHDSSIRVDFESFSIVIISIFVFEKHDFLRTSTERGMQIDDNEQEWKRDSSIRIDFDSF